jgi:hypothetical protein
MNTLLGDGTMITDIKTVVAHAKALYWKTRMEKAKEHMDKYKAVLSTAGSGKHETEYGTFTVSENNSYPPLMIAEQLTEDEIEMCMESKWSNERARILFPKQYEASRVRNGYKVSL